MIGAVIVFIRFYICQNDTHEAPTTQPPRQCCPVQNVSQSQAEKRKSTPIAKYSNNPSLNNRKALQIKPQIAPINLTFTMFYAIILPERRVLSPEHLEGTIPSSNETTVSTLTTERKNDEMSDNQTNPTDKLIDRNRIARLTVFIASILLTIWLCTSAGKLVMEWLYFLDGSALCSVQHLAPTLLSLSSEDR